MDSNFPAEVKFSNIKVKINTKENIMEEKRFNPWYDIILLGISVMIATKVLHFFLDITFPNSPITNICISILFLAILCCAISCGFKRRILLFGSIYPGRIDTQKSEKIVKLIWLVMIGLIIIATFLFLRGHVMKYSTKGLSTSLMRWIILVICLSIPNFIVYLCIEAERKHVERGQNKTGK